jgi:hypothetical protein
MLVLDLKKEKRSESRRTIGSSYHFKTLKELTAFHKRTGKRNKRVCEKLFEFFFENPTNLCFITLKKLSQQPIEGFDAIFNTHPTLEHTFMDG